MLIRPFQDDDREAVLDIAARVFEPVSIDAAIERCFGRLNGTTWQERKRRDVAAELDANPGGCFVAEADGEVAGFVTTAIDRQAAVGYIPNLAVAADRQGEGIGTRLLSHALDYFEAEGLQYCRIETTTTNERGMRLYPRMGYREVARKIYYFMNLADRKDR